MLDVILYRIAVAILGIFIIAYFLWEGFEAFVLPRTITRGWRFTSVFYKTLWFRFWLKIARRFHTFRQSDIFLGFFGPVSMILLLSLWALALILGFGLIQWAVDPNLGGTGRGHSIGTYLYFSGVTFFTLGYGDITPAGPIGRLAGVIEAGVGFGFIAIIIGHLPILYGAFSRRESSVSLLDARAGSPPTALEALVRHARFDALDNLRVLLKEQERWCAEVLESHLSYPVLAYYRSQHDDQSWLAALVFVLDVSAIIMTGLEGIPAWQAKLTFSMGRHALVDFCLIFNAAPARSYLS